MLTLISSSTDEQFATTAAVKNLLGLTTTSDDPLINSLITRSSRWAETYINRGPLGAASWRETLAGFGGRRMMLSRRPVYAVPSLWGATDTGTATTYLSSEFKVDKGAGFIERDAGFAWDVPPVPRGFATMEGGPFSGEERSPWLVDYMAGYSYAGIATGSANWSTAHGTTSTGRTLPEDIEEAVRHRVAAIYEGNQGIVSRAVGDLRIQYATANDGQVYDPAVELLKPYRAVI